jgi:hypothetical protein
MFVCCEYCVLSGRGFCDGLITRPKESYRLWRVVVCDQETSNNRRLKPATGLWKIQPQWVVTPGKQTNKHITYILNCDLKKKGQQVFVIIWYVSKNLQLNGGPWKWCQWAPKRVGAGVNMWYSIHRMVRLGP